MSSNKLSGFDTYAKTYSSSDFNNTGIQQANTSSAVSSIQVPVYDLYNSCTQCGVYMLRNGSPPAAIPISANNLSIFGLNNSDGGYLIYPGFACQIFSTTNYNTDTSNHSLSYILFNNTTTPQVFNCSSSTIGGTDILNTLNAPYANTNSESIRIWCNGKYLYDAGTTWST